MQQIRLHVPYRTQTDSFDCSLASVQMMLAYYGDEVSLDEIKANSDVERWLNPNIKKVHVQGALFFLLDREYRVTFFHHDPNVIDSEVEGATDAKTLRNRLAELEQDTRETEYQKTKLALDAEFIERGGIYRNTVPTLADIDNALEQGIPVRIGIENKAFFTEPANPRTHSVLVVGRDADSYTILDPAPQRGPEYTVDRNLLLLSWYRNGAYTIIVEKCSD